MVSQKLRAGLLLASLCLLGTSLSVYAQNSPTEPYPDSTAPRRARTADWLRTDPIWKENRWKKKPESTRDRVYRKDYDAVNGTDGNKKYQTVSDPDNQLQHFILMRQPGGLRLENAAGIVIPYCGSLTGTFNGRDSTMYGGTGYFNALNLDYLWNRELGNKSLLQYGLGLTFGGQHITVREDDWDENLRKWATRNRINSYEKLPAKGSTDYFLLAGPVVSLPLGKPNAQKQYNQWYLDLMAKAGIYRTEAAFLTARYGADMRLLDMVAPASKRTHFGYMGSVGLSYRWNQHWGLGLTARLFRTEVEYMRQGIDNMQLRVFDRKHGGLNLGAVLSYRFNERKVLPVDCPVPPQQPVCEVPEVESATLLTISGEDACKNLELKWKSQTGDVTYFISVGKAGEKQEYKQVQSGQNTYTAKLCLNAGDTSSTFYYSIYSSRNQNGQTCMSVAALGHVNIRRPVIPCEASYEHKVYYNKIRPSLQWTAKDTLCVCTTGEKIKKWISKERVVPANIQKGFTTIKEKFTLNTADITIPDSIKVQLKGYGANKAVEEFSLWVEIQKVDCKKNPIGEVQVWEAVLNKKGEVESYRPITLPANVKK